VLQGVLPTRRLILSAPDARLADIMVRTLITLPAWATVLEACEFFILHRLLAFPVVDDAGRLVGIVDIDFYRRALEQDSATAPATRLLRPLTRFFQIESSGGIVLVLCTIVALALANSPWAAAFAHFWRHEPASTSPASALKKELLHWINDGLMTLFFFVVGLEIKRDRRRRIEQLAKGAAADRRGLAAWSCRPSSI